MSICGGCRKQLASGQGYLFYSEYCPMPGVMSNIGNLLLCEQCTNCIVRKESWSGKWNGTLLSILKRNWSF